MSSIYVNAPTLKTVSLRYLPTFKQFRALAQLERAEFSFVIWFDGEGGRSVKMQRQDHTICDVWSDGTVNGQSVTDYLLSLVTF